MQRQYTKVAVEVKKPFVAVNCSAIPESLFESEMFGIERGVATGVTGRIGKMELANGGTFFLDEIGVMPLSCQSKMISVIEDMTIERVGGKMPIAIDIVSATHRDLKRGSER